MDYFALFLPVLLIVGMFVGLVILKRRLFGEESTQAPIPIPDIRADNGASLDTTAARPVPSTADETATETAARPVAALAEKAATGSAPPVAAMPGSLAASTGVAGADANGVSLTPARLYPSPLLPSAHKAIYSRLLKALPGYAVLPKIAYGHFLEARDGTPSENTSLQNRAAQQLADFVICDRKLNVLLVCQVEDGTELPARIQEREKMLQKAGLRLLRWKVDNPPDAGKLLSTIQTLEKLNTPSVKASG